jgi:hypothetical protein
MPDTLIRGSFAVVKIPPQINDFSPEYTIKTAGF